MGECCFPEGNQSLWVDAAKSMFPSPHRTQAIMLQNATRDRKGIFLVQTASDKASRDIAVIGEAKKKDTFKWIKIRADHCYCVHGWRRARRPNRLVHWRNEKRNICQPSRELLEEAFETDVK